MRDYTKIEAWRHADDATVAVYQLTQLLPREEIYGMTSQMRRAAVSVSSNIAEGSARDSKRDYLHFLYIARGSLSEVQYLIHLAGRLGYIGAETAKHSTEWVQETFRCLHGLIHAVEKETGRLPRTIATITSAIALCLVHATTTQSYGM